MAIHLNKMIMIKQ